MNIYTISWLDRNRLSKKCSTINCTFCLIYSSHVATCYKYSISVLSLLLPKKKNDNLQILTYRDKK